MEYAMPVRLGFLLLTIFCGIAVGADVLAPPPDLPQLSIRYLNETDKTQVLANHTLTTSAEGKIDFNSGGELPHQDDEPTLCFGTRINGELTPIDRQSYRLSITMELGNPVVSEDSTTQIVRSETLAIRTLLAPGKDTRIHCGGNRWIELHVDN